MIKTKKNILTNKPYVGAKTLGLALAPTTKRGKAKGHKKPVKNGATAIKRQLVQKKQVGINVK